MELKKSPQADIENKRNALASTGLMVALAFVLIAFQWVSFEKKEIKIYNRVMDVLEDEIIEMAELPPPPLNTPPPPPPPPPATPEELDIVEDDEDIEETEITFLDEIDTVPPAPPAIVAPVVDDAVYEVVEQQAGYPGGFGELMKYLGENIKYPAMAREAGVTGKVYVSFVVEKDGSVTDVKLLRGIGSGCDEEAIRVVKSMKNWIPAQQRGKAVRSRFKLPVIFRLK